MHGALYVARQEARGLPRDSSSLRRFGVAVGKYCTYVHFLKEAIKEQSGETAASTVSWFSQDVILNSLLHDFNIIFSGIDILWVALAVCPAWWMAKGLRPRLQGRESS